MNDYIKREDALKLFAGGEKYPEGSFQRRLGELGTRLIMEIPAASVVEDDNPPPTTEEPEEDLDDGDW